MKKQNYGNRKGFFRAARRWFLETPERSLNLAYKAAIEIREIEKKHFNGKCISPKNSPYGESVYALYESDLSRNLSIIKLRLREFRNSRSFIEIYKQSRFGEESSSSAKGDRTLPEGVGLSREQQSMILDRLNFIDEITSKYRNKSPIPTTAVSRSPVEESASREDSSSDSAPLLPSVTKTYGIEPKNRGPLKPKNKTEPRVDLDTDKELGNQGNNKKELGSLADQTSFLPRSILRTLDRLKRELDPKAEEEVVQEFRSSKTKTIVSLKFILLLILIPLLTQQVAKNFIVGPIYDSVVGDRAEIFLNVDMKEEALIELNHFHERLEFEQMIAQTIEELPEEEKEELNFIGKIPHHLSEEEIHHELQHKAIEIAEEYSRQSSNAVKNIFSDIFSFLAFGVVIYNSKREIQNVKSFMDDIVYGLSDSAKAFIIILFTDIFVGFHSPHGWEIILEGISRHLGLPESREFIFLFIATFPVILDTVFKYWIFRYLNRISPSAVATYRNMNE